MSIDSVLAGRDKYHFECGDSISVLKTMPDQVINLVVTSPPYSGLRDYDNAIWEGGDPNCQHLRQNQRDPIDPKQTGKKHNRNIRARKRESTRVCGACGAVRTDTEIGAESSPDCYGWVTDDWCGECYTCRIVQVFDEVWRVLRDDGVVFLNLGDSFNGYPGNAVSSGPIRAGAQHARQRKAGGYGLVDDRLKEKDLLGVPWSVAKALQMRGWYLRADIIWAKATVLPESVAGWRWEQHRVGSQEDRKDCPGCEQCNPHNGLVLRRGAWRPTRSHECIFQLSKSPKYFMDPLAVRQLPSEASLKRIRQPNLLLQKGGVKDARNADPSSHRSSRTTMENFAENPGRNLWDVWVIPPSPLGEKHYASFPTGLPELAIRSTISQGGYCEHCGSPYARIYVRGSESQGWKPTCKCNTIAPVSGIVLDPFSGSGTTVRVASALGVRGIGIDLNPEYNKLAERLMKDVDLMVKNQHSVLEVEQLTLF